MNEQTNERHKWKQHDSRMGAMVVVSRKKKSDASAK